MRKYFTVATVKGKKNVSQVSLGWQFMFHYVISNYKRKSLALHWLNKIWNLTKKNEEVPKLTKNYIKFSRWNCNKPKIRNFFFLNPCNCSQC